MKNYIKKNWSTILLVLVFAAGLSLLLYPTVADWWNNLNSSYAVSDYQNNVAKLSDEEYARIFEESEIYNNDLLKEPNRFNPTDSMHERYQSLLAVGEENSRMMGILKIPSIRVNLPIYHGTEESVLKSAVGHIEGSSLPIGGESTHTIISGHRGLPSAKLLTDLDKLEEGDYFTITVLDDTCTYMVDQIKIVEPEDFTYLQIEPGEDLATLVTCTPYGINTHRLLVRGHRVDNLPDDFINTRNEAMLIDNKLVALFIAVPVLIALFVWVMVRGRKKKV
ncbi:class C sortase [uncultured Faecalibaculum sp.]|uniref:class C sortase n=1 Tax=uncultured Faecalibaculum sp. TaxID=1729681 RepID=UPI0025DC5AA4|nr:class C sortase [uncultured Faecalibaculum sp.]